MLRVPHDWRRLRGCVVDLLTEDAAEGFARRVTSCYRKVLGLVTAVFEAPAFGVVLLVF